MTKPTGSIRPIKYPLDRTLDTSSDTPNTPTIEQSIENWSTTDPDERVNVVINLSLNEWVALATTIDVGRDIAYGDNSIYIWWLWSRILKSMTICTDVADCLINSAEVIAALQQTIIDNGIYTAGQANSETYIVEQTFPQSERDTTDIQVPPVGCDNDILWAGIRELVERLCDQAKTVLENITAQSDKFQRISEFLDTVPIVGGAADALVKNVVDSAQDMLNLFNAYDSINTRDDLACEIFEIVCEDCRYPTYSELYEAIGNNAIGGMDDLSIVNVAVALSQFVVASSAAQSIAWHTMLAFELFVLYADSKFLELYGRNAIGIMTSLGEDVPSNDWETLCNCAPTVNAVEYDFTVNNGGWVLMATGKGTYVPSTGWIASDNGSSTGVWIYHSLPVDTVIEKVEFEWSGDNVSWRRAAILRDNPESSAGQVDVMDTTSITTGGTDCGDLNSAHRDSIIAFINYAAGISPDATLTKIKLQYTGTKPTGYTSDSGVIFSC